MHRLICGLASFEGPKAHGLVKYEQWRAEFGSPQEPRAPWEYAFPTGCMYGCRSPAPDALAIEKSSMLVANFARSSHDSIT